MKYMLDKLIIMSVNSQHYYQIWPVRYVSQC